MTFTTEELKKLRTSLPKGASQTLADKFSLKPGSVRNILSGFSKNDDLLLAAIELANEHQVKISSAKATLSI
jgi:hypothetical protein